MQSTGLLINERFFGLCFMLLSYYHKYHNVSSNNLCIELSATRTSPL